jgi:hypothetical protein
MKTLHGEGRSIALNEREKSGIQGKIFDGENRKRTKLLRPFTFPLPSRILDPELFCQVGSGVIGPGYRLSYFSKLPAVPKMAEKSWIIYRFP